MRMAGDANRVLTTIVITLAASMLSGCALFLVGAGVAAGAGTLAYMNGELKAAEEVSMESGWRGAMRAMDDLEFKIAKSQKDALAGIIIATRADGTRITIKVKKQSEQITEFRVRVGTLGDESLSRLIYERIKKRL